MQVRKVLKTMHILHVYYHVGGGFAKINTSESSATC